MIFWCQSCGEQHTQPHVTSANITTCARCGGSHFATWKPVRQSLSQEAVREEALEKILDRRCTNPKPVGDSACDCCQHHWFAILGHTPIEEYRALKREPNAPLEEAQQREIDGLEVMMFGGKPTRKREPNAAAEDDGICPSFKQLSREERERHAAAPDVAGMVKDYPNLYMMLHGAVSGPHTDWPLMRRELTALLAKLGQQVETLQAAHDLGWAHKTCPNCGADIMTGASHD